MDSLFNIRKIEKILSFTSHSICHQADVASTVEVLVEGSVEQGCQTHSGLDLDHGTPCRLDLIQDAPSSQ